MAVGKSSGNSASRYGSVRNSASSQDLASWEDADSDELWKTITAIVNAGDAVTLGRTRDGGALSLVILSGDDRIRRYARGADEIHSLLVDIRTSLEATD
jgi:hypothetical protein